MTSTPMNAYKRLIRSECATRESTYANVGNWILFLLSQLYADWIVRFAPVWWARKVFVGQSVLNVEEKWFNCRLAWLLFMKKKICLFSGHSETSMRLIRYVFLFQPEMFYFLFEKKKLNGLETIAFGHSSLPYAPHKTTLSACMKWKFEFEWRPE